jgi:hypothetical protein
MQQPARTVLFFLSLFPLRSATIEEVNRQPTLYIKFQHIFFLTFLLVCNFPSLLFVAASITSCVEIETISICGFSPLQMAKASIKWLPVCVCIQINL